MSDSNLSSFAARIMAAERTGEVWHLLLGFMRARGVVRLSVHALDSLWAGGDTVIRTAGFPEDWVTHYANDSLFDDDPIPAQAAKTTRPFFWGDIKLITNVTAAEAEYLRELETAEIGEGLAMQVYGPNLRSAYVGLGFGPVRPDLTEAQIFELKSAAQIAHLRFCELTEAHAALERDLSPREAEVLRWIAQGKSNGVIAEIVGLSRHTVDTVVRRIFEKLGVTDRTTAALRGLGAGLVQLEGGTPPVTQVRDMP
ncbi:MAG: LuxR family transcriptional regulator [Pseudomonadota bacterium]